MTATNVTVQVTVTARTPRDLGQMFAAILDLCDDHHLDAGQIAGSWQCVWEYGQEGPCTEWFDVTITGPVLP
jgi:hypothetical protein